MNEIHFVSYLLTDTGQYFLQVISLIFDEHQ